MIDMNNLCSAGPEFLPDNKVKLSFEIPGY